MDLSREPIRGGDRSEFHENFGRVLRSLSPDKALELKRARAFFAGAAGVNGLTSFYELVNGLSAAEIVEKHKSSGTKPIISGEVDGVRFTLRDTPTREESSTGDNPHEG